MSDARQNPFKLCLLCILALTKRKTHRRNVPSLHERLLSPRFVLISAMGLKYVIILRQLLAAPKRSKTVKNKLISYLNNVIN